MQFHTSYSPDSAAAERLEAQRKAHKAKDNALAESHAELMAALDNLVATHPNCHDLCGHGEGCETVALHYAEVALTKARKL